MAQQNYPEVVNYDSTLPHSSSSSSRPSLYPTVDHDLSQPLFPDNYASAPPYEPYSPSIPPSAPAFLPSAPVDSVHDSLLVIPGAILHLIDNQYSVELATGDLVVHRLRNGDNTVAVLASVADEIQWPLTKDVATVKLDDTHYFFSFTPPPKPETHQKKKKNKKSKEKEKEKLEDDILSYGLTIASRGQEGLVRELEGVLESYSSFSVQKVEKKAEAEVLDGAVEVARELSPADLKSETKKEVAEERCAAYWTTLAPNVEEYSGTAAKYIASGSGQLIKGILWCGDVTSDRLKWGNDALRKRMAPGAKAEISPQTMQRIQRF